MARVPRRAGRDGPGAGSRPGHRRSPPRPLRLGATPRRGAAAQGAPGEAKGDDLPIQSIEQLQSLLGEKRYVADRGLAASIFLALKLERPLFVEGEAGVGKTEIAKVLAEILGSDLIRLQCYEGIDVSQAVYDWSYSRQMLHIRLAESRKERVDERELFGREFLLERPLLKAIDPEADRSRVLLIDEIDRSDDEFEAFLLELLSDFQITIPEIGTVRAKRRPVVVVTSNRTREVHDALKRRCLYFWIDYPSFQKELEIVRTKLPEASERLSNQVTRYVQELRQTELYKVPGVAETLDWTRALTALDKDALDEETVDETLGALLKYRDDIEKVRGDRSRDILARVAADA